MGLTLRFGRGLGTHVILATVAILASPAGGPGTRVILVPALSILLAPTSLTLIVVSPQIPAIVTGARTEV